MIGYITLFGTQKITKKRNEATTVIAINKTEKEYICGHFPSVHIVRTMKQKSKRHHYYCEENRQLIRFLSKIRNGI